MAILDTLYCEEEQWEFEEENEIVEENNSRSNEGKQIPSLFPILLLEQELFWEDEELISLFSKEEKQRISKQGNFDFDISLSSARREAVEWMLMVNGHYGFCTLTSILAVNYLDRFLSIFHFQKEKPWMMQLSAVTCLSLAAKVEESDVPILLDLQMNGTEYMFEPKNIQKMELLVLSTLEWKMNPVNPLSFLDHIIRRLGLKNHLHWEFFRRCERLLLSLLPDWRFVSYLPSVLATASMMHVIDQIEPCNPLEYQNQLLGVLNINKEKVKDCYQLIVEISCGSNGNDNNVEISSNSKRKDEEMMKNMNGCGGNYNKMKMMPSSPSGVIDSAYSSLSSDTSNDSWATTTTTTTTCNYNHNYDHDHNHVSEGLSTLSSSSVSSSSVISRKKRRVHEQHMTLHLSSLSTLFVDVVGSPR